MEDRETGLPVAKFKPGDHQAINESRHAMVIVGEKEKRLDLEILASGSDRLTTSRLTRVCAPLFPLA
jgi:hypothetical protein